MLKSDAPRRTSFIRPRAEWFAVASGLWVAVSAGMHNGRIESVNGLFVAVDDRNRQVGRFSTLRAAMSAIECGEIGDDVDEPIAA